MRLVKAKGGYSIGVYNPVKNDRGKVYKLYNDNRLNFYAPADYSQNSRLFKYITEIMDDVSAKENIKSEQKLLEQYAVASKVQGILENAIEKFGAEFTDDQKNEFKSLSRMMDSIQNKKIAN